MTSFLDEAAEGQERDLHMLDMFSASGRGNEIFLEVGYNAQASDVLTDPAADISTQSRAQHYPGRATLQLIHIPVVFGAQEERVQPARGLHTG